MRHSFNDDGGQKIQTMLIHFKLFTWYVSSVNRKYVRWRIIIVFFLIRFVWNTSRENMVAAEWANQNNHYHLSFNC